jgi:GcrA cell cycle regulator
VIGKAHRLGLSSRPSPIKRVTEKAASGTNVMKTRLNSPKAMGLRRDVMIGTGAYKGQDASMRGDDQDMRSRRSEGGGYSPRVFKSAQTATQAATQQCRWPVGDPLKAGFHFCESMSIPGLPYCYDHACMAYQGSKKKSPSAPREDVAAESAEQVQFGAVNNS